MAEDHDWNFKLVLIGDQDVGKSSILTRFCDDEFEETTVQATTSIDSKSKTITDEDGHRIRMNVWDTAGQERFRTITSSYYRGADGIIVTYDITNPKSFENLDIWLTQSERYASDNVSLLIVGNKSDLEDKRQVDGNMAAALAKDRNIPYLETSAKTGANVQEAFQMIAEAIKSQIPAEPDPGVVQLDTGSGGGAKCKC